MAVITICLPVYLARDIHQPFLVAVTLLAVPAMALMVGEIQTKGVLLVDTQLFIGDVVVPADKINGVAKVIAVCTVISGTALVPFPGAIFGLRITVRIGWTRTRDKAP